MVINFNITIYCLYGSSSVRLAYLNISGNLPQTFRRKSRDSNRTDVCLFDLPCRTKFLREFNFGNGRFFFVCAVLRELLFAMGETGFSCWELLFAIFRNSPSIWNYSILDFRVQTMEYR